MSFHSLLSFIFENQNVRVMVDLGETRWVLADICQVLDLQNPSDVAKRLPLTCVPLGISEGRGGIREVLTINEEGLYRLIFTSRKPQAEKFVTWVFQEVLPQIRKNSFYAIGIEDQSQVPDVLNKVAETVKQCGIPRFLIRATVDGMKFESSYK